MGAREACGVFGICSARGVNVAPKMLTGLQALQHRGQESWGIAVNGKPVFRKMGLVANWTRFASELQGYTGSSGIGHVRYSTSGRSTIANAQPVQIGSDFSIAHNGTIVNTEELGGLVGQDCGSDTKLVGLLLLKLLKEENDWFWAFKRLAEEVVGAYSFVFLTKRGEVFAARDPRGYRPLCLGWHKASRSHVVASESCALAAVDAEFVRDIEPGEVVRLGGQDSALAAFRFAPRVEPAYCSFEYTYFAHPSSTVNGVNVYKARKNVGKTLAEKHKLRGQVVVPVPDSARPAALGYSLKSGIPTDEGLMKDRYVRKGSMRSFIEPRQRGREEVVRKIIPIRQAVEGKDVILIDDSVVRGTSSRIIVRTLREAGARKVRMAVTFPPISHPCYMGVDFPSREELLAHQVANGGGSLQEVASKVGKAIGSDEFRYNDTRGLANAIGLPENSLCFACVNGDYSKLGRIPREKTRKEMKG